MCQKRRDSVAHLNILLRSAAMKEVVVREGLETGNLPHGETPALTRIGMNVVMTIFGYVARDGGRRLIGYLHPVAVVEFPVFQLA